MTVGEFPLCLIELFQRLLDGIGGACGKTANVVGDGRERHSDDLQVFVKDLTLGRY